MLVREVLLGLVGRTYVDTSVDMGGRSRSLVTGRPRRSTSRRLGQVGSSYDPPRAEPGGGYWIFAPRAAELLGGHCEHRIA